ncbi:hypothetical protein MNBD_GAMMA12-2718 [hydrothermal vent metagenome]|uniref:CENP-V/GFA domain-containing protein n=1 Tax=hydrothermal vent metagenome TaxID=652676 RepID=A0A3B0Y6Q8_9ZZZZ
MHLGSCECHAVQYQFSGDPLTCYACHCTDCQTSSGSAFSLSMIVNDKHIELRKGKVAINVIDMNGVNVNKHHCSDCGSALWFSADEYPGMAALKPGTFDDTSWFEPIAHLWVRSKQSWLVLEATVRQYDTQVEISELVGLWAEKYAV